MPTVTQLDLSCVTCCAEGGCVFCSPATGSWLLDADNTVQVDFDDVTDNAGCISNGDKYQYPYTLINETHFGDPFCAGAKGIPQPAVTCADFIFGFIDITMFVTIYIDDTLIYPQPITGDLTRPNVIFPPGVKVIAEFLFRQTNFPLDDPFIKVFYEVIGATGEPADCQSAFPLTMNTFIDNNINPHYEFDRLNQITLRIPPPAASATEAVAVPDPVSGDPDFFCWYYDGNWVTSGANIRTWTDAGDEGNDATQATDSNNPDVVSGGLGGRDCADFDGSTDHMDFTSVTLEDFTLLAVLSRSSSAAGTDTVIGGDAGNYIAWDGSQVVIRAGYVTTTIGTTSVPDDQAFLLTVRRNNSDLIRTRINGKEMSGSGVTNANDIASVRVLGSYETGNRWHGRMGGLRLYTRALSEGEMVSVEDYFFDRWTIPEL